MIAPLAVRSFRARATSSGGLDAALRLTFDFWYCGVRIRPAQVRSEIAQFLGVISSHPPQVVLEVGTANGGSFFLLSRVASSEALLVSVDLPGGTFGGGYPSWRVPLYKSFARGNQRIRLLRADSHDPETVRQVLELLEGRPVDLLFIDGDHTYSGVKADLEMYSPLVRVGGLIGFHDIVPGPEADVGGVPRLWEEIKARVQTNEIVELAPGRVRNWVFLQGGSKRDWLILARSAWAGSPFSRRKTAQVVHAPPVMLALGRVHLDPPYRGLSEILFYRITYVLEKGNP